jgi:hypothetical protein
MIANRLNAWERGGNIVATFEVELNVRGQAIDDVTVRIGVIALEVTQCDGQIEAKRLGCHPHQILLIM